MLPIRSKSEIGVSKDKQFLIAASLAQAYEVRQFLEAGADVNTKDEVSTKMLFSVGN